MFILHQTKKNLGAKHKFQVTTSETVHISKSVMLTKKKEKMSPTTTKKTNINTNKSFFFFSKSKYIKVQTQTTTCKRTSLAQREIIQ